MGKSRTVEERASKKNGMGRLIVTIVAIVLEILFILFLFITLNRFAVWIEILTRIVGVALVLIIYAQPKTSTMKMPWLILISAFPVLGVFLYVMVGLNGYTWVMRRRYKELDDQIFALVPDTSENLHQVQEGNKQAYAVARYLEKYGHAPLYESAGVTYYDDTMKALEAQLEDMKKAEKFIFMEYHAIEDSVAWARVEEVLVDRVRHGVEVRVFYDDLGSLPFVNSSFAKKLRGLGIKCRAFNPFVPGINLFLNNRDHRKFTIIDGRVGYTGGFNMADEYFNITHPYGQWKDSGVRLVGPAVNTMTMIYMEMWNAVKRQGDPDPDLSAYLVEPDTTPQAGAGGYVQVYADSPMDDEQVGENVYIAMLEKAERYCWFTTPYLIITDEMSHAMIMAVKRGVDVRIVTPAIPDKKIVFSVTRSFYSQLVKEGVRIYEWTPGFCHTKDCLVDDKMCTCGTINLDYRSLYHHFEDGVFFCDSPVIWDIKADFERTFAESLEVTDEYRTGRSRRLRLGQLVLRLIAELM